MGHINASGLTTTGVAGVNYTTVKTTPSIADGTYTILPVGFWIVFPKTDWAVYFLADDGTTETLVSAASGGGLFYSDGTRMALKNSTGNPDTTTYIGVYL